jgi:hypothetical protein
MVFNTTFNNISVISWWCVYTVKVLISAASNFRGFSQLPSARQRHQIEPYDHMKDAAFFYDVTERFKKGMQLDPEVKRKNVEVNTISKVTSSRLYKRSFILTR